MGPEMHQVFALRYAKSVWRDGSVQNLGLYDDFFVWTPLEHAEIRTYVLNGSGRWAATYAAPRAMGPLEITRIDPTGLEVNFRSEDGATGSFNLKTQQWSFE
jgi:hypothetical protein